ncbi:MAG: exo-beta-N-acetylmuramidase NamZ domain-containing protein [Myxococcota bacterium]
MQCVRTGLEVLTEDRCAEVQSGAWGLLAHAASVDRNLRHALARLEERGVDVPVLFGPEHGWSGAAQDMESVSTDGGTYRRVVSLYGSNESSLVPKDDDVSGLSGVIIDLQDVGARYYTYAVTALYMLRSCAKFGLPVYILDRPNPLGGTTVEGGSVASGYESFVSAFPVPVRHGLTLAELAAWAVAREGLHLDLRLVRMQGWRRTMYFDETGLPWVMPSPNMPTLDTAIVYPGGCLIEGTNLSEGRGTTRPFELIGAPWLPSTRFAEDTSVSAGPGVLFRPTEFKPMFQKHQGLQCGGLQIHVMDRSRFSSLRTTVAQLISAKHLAGGAFAWREEAYEFVRDRLAIDLLFGTDEPRRAIESNASVSEVMELFSGFAEEFSELRRSYLLY